MRHWLISVALSGWAAGASVIINLLLAFQLPVSEYGAWIRLTALLPLVTALMAPMVLMCSRVAAEQATQTRLAARALMLSAVGAGCLALVLIVFGVLLKIEYLAAIALWLVSVCKVAQDGLLWSPNIVRLGIADKVARSLSPSAVLFALLVFQPTTNTVACWCIAGATGTCSMGVMHWFSKHLDPVTFNFRQTIELYFHEMPSAYLSLVSLGVFSFPLFLFSTQVDHAATASLGISLTVVQGASAFATIVLSQHLLSIANALTLNSEHRLIRLRAPIAITLICCLLAPVLTGGYGLYRSIPGWPAIALATAYLVLVETSQGMITGILLRLGSRKVIVSATVSAILNVAMSVTLSDPIELICAIASVQFVSFLLPGLWQIHKRIKTSSINLKVSI